MEQWFNETIHQTTNQSGAVEILRLTARSAVCYPLAAFSAAFGRQRHTPIPCMFVLTRTRYAIKSPPTTGCLKPASSTSRPTASRLMVVLLGSVAVGVLLHTDVAHAKRKQVQGDQPDLRIVAVTASPEPYSPGAGSLNFTIEVELPKDLDGATILEVSSLISSPSKSSLRFLSNRQPVKVPPPTDSAAEAQPPQAEPPVDVGGATPQGPPADTPTNQAFDLEGDEKGSRVGVGGESPRPSPTRISVTLTWDGTDQTKQVVGNGKYGYEVRAKLLAIGENGLRTERVSWPKRGTLSVK